MSKDNLWIVAILYPLIIFLVFLSSIFVRTMIDKWEVSSLEHKIEISKLEASYVCYEKNK